MTKKKTTQSGFRRTLNKPLIHLKKGLKAAFTWWHKRRLWQQAILCVLLVTTLFISSMYGIATWYRLKHNDEPLTLGVSFSAGYAASMGLNPQETLEAMLKDLQPQRVRLMSYWNEHEKTPGKYDFSNLDWQFALAEKYNAKVSLAVGLRQPRWPECHFPDWTKDKTEAEITRPIEDYIGVVVNRYKQHPALSEYQLENEYFLKVFGKCQNYRTRERLVDEYNLIKQLDPDHPIVVSRSNNALGFPAGDPIPDISAVSVYKRVWDKTITKRYLEYPFPGWFYGSLAGVMEIAHGKPTIIHELQAEPWPPSGAIVDNSLEEQDKSMDAARLKDRARYAISSGIRTIDFWGAEWWYWRLTKANDPSVWETGKNIFEEADQK